jgi:energy-coupling factor transport system ATP-binding protein
LDDILIEIKGLHHVFFPGTPLEKAALSGINLSVGRGEFIALIGRTGSGKTTLALSLNGLLTPTRGTVRVGDVIVGPKTKKTAPLRERVGLVFQYPEHQLFEETVIAEISFGLVSRGGLSDEEVKARVYEAARLVNLDLDRLKDRSPFTLSGGEQRKVAIASIICMDPDILVFDEPTQGLDSRSRGEALRHIKQLNDRGKTVIIISHDMEEVIGTAHRIVILDKGRIVLDRPPDELFDDPEALDASRPFLPDVTQLLIGLREKGWDIKTNTYRSDRALTEILAALGASPNQRRGAGT